MKRILLFALLTVLSLDADAQKLRVAFVGDPQVDNETELGYAQRSIYRELKSRKDLDMVVFLGDLVNDKASLLEVSKASLDSLGCPWYCVPGNHDRDMYRGKQKRVRDLETWKKVIGPADIAFYRNGIRFILMNNVRHSPKGEYEGGFTDSQKVFLDSVLRETPLSCRTVIATHIPFSQMRGRDSLMTIIGKHPSVFFVSGHTHNVSRHTLRQDDRYEELVAGASCGTWWRGQADSKGIPYALQNCGAPKGYFIADFTRNDIRVTYKPTDADDQASAYLAIDPETGLRKLYINVFGGHRDGKLKMRIPSSSGKWTKLERTAEVAPEVSAIIKFNKSLSREEKRKRGGEIIPLRKMKSPHLWVAELPEGLEVPQTLRVAYEDPMMSFRTRLTINEIR